MMWLELLLLGLAVAVVVLVWAALAVGLFNFADYMSRRHDAKRERDAFVPFHDLLG